MKKLFFSLFMAMACLVASAVPAIPTLQKVTQPNGEQLTVKIKGDEFHHYMTTVDEYTIVKNNQGYYAYGTLVNDEVVASKIIARDADKRSASDNAWLQATGKNLKSASKIAAGIRARAQRDALPHLNTINYNNFHGLVILVEFNDSHFTRSDVQTFYDNMINQENYTGTDKTNIYRNVGSNWRHIANDIICTGSMRDYFRDNSNGVFNPTFDIVGPVSVNRSQFYPNGGNSAYDNNVRTIQLLTDVFTAADSQVNFADYDVNKDGKVDMVYIIFAGHSAHVSGNSQSRLWPHQSDLSFRQIRKDGVILGRYACSTELFGFDGSDGTASWSVLEGIGTMCHEFSHVLGLPDFYDTDYSEGGGQSADPGGWSVMANGADYDTGRRPCAYSLYERYALGFATPQVIDQPGDFSLDHVATSNTG